MDFGTKNLGLNLYQDLSGTARRQRQVVEVLKEQIKPTLTTEIQVAHSDLKSLKTPQFSQTFTVSGRYAEPYFRLIIEVIT